jgi:hypothetical protein
MNKRSAVIAAAGLVVALTAGGVALDRGMLGPSPTTAEASAASRAPGKPTIRTIEHTVKIHRKANSSGTANRSPAVSSTPASGDAWADDDAFEHEFEHESEDESGDD